MGIEIHRWNFSGCLCLQCIYPVGDVRRREKRRHLDGRKAEGDGKEGWRKIRINLP